MLDTRSAPSLRSLAGPESPPKPASLRRLHHHHRPKEEGTSAGDRRAGPVIWKRSGGGWCRRRPAHPRPLPSLTALGAAPRPLPTARRASYLCVELGRGHGGPVAPTPPARAEAAPRLGRRPRRLGSAQAAAGGESGTTGRGGAGRLRLGRPAGASPSLPGSPRAAASNPRARDRRSRRRSPLGGR